MSERFNADECASCAINGGRRQFLREAALSVAAVVTALGMPSSARALQFVNALSVNKGEIAYAIPASDGVMIDKPNEVILVRNQGAVYAFSLSCPHQKTALRFKENDNRFECPKHKSKYQPDGTYISGRATRSMDRYALTRQGDEILVSTGILYREDTDKAAWAAALVKLDEKAS